VWQVAEKVSPFAFCLQAALFSSLPGPTRVNYHPPLRSARWVDMLDMTVRWTIVACALLAASQDLDMPSAPAFARSRAFASQPTMTFPEATISNGQITARIYLPDPQRGFYRSTRFDWSGMIASLEYGGHQYYGPWFTGSDPSVRDFVYRGSEILVSAQSGALGPAEEFQRPQGYSTAKPGETFVKIGVGVLRKKADAPYSAYDTY